MFTGDPCITNPKGEVPEYREYMLHMVTPTGRDGYYRREAQQTISMEGVISR
jgi:hypothetical protein